MFILENSKELTDERLADFIEKHKQLVATRFQKLKDAYMTEYDIMKMQKKDSWKPDNRIAVNFAKYITDTMNGFFIGHPIKFSVEGEEENVTKFVEFIDQYNDQDDSNAELSKLCSMFGRGYEIYYLDSLANQCIMPVSVMDGFMIYDESIVARPRFFVRLYMDTDKLLHGSVSDDKVVKYFTKPGDIVWDNGEYPDGKPHGYDGVPATEFRENEERVGIYEPVMSMIDAYNKAISEKANDVDYFADAYLKILGPKVDEDSQKLIRTNRIINFKGQNSEKMVVEFLSKPDGDTSQEHLIDRLEKLIFQISMVANISDENFGSSSGIALKYKLQAMSNLAKTKERKFISGLNRRYRIIFSNPANLVPSDDWVKLHFHFTQNYPANITEEIENAKNLEGMVSKETQLKLLSIVEDAQAEIERLKDEDTEYKEKMGADM